MTKYILEIDEEEDAYYGESMGATIIRVDWDGTRTEVGFIGSEPEDNTHFRAYSWILPELNEAYRRGVEDGRAL